MLRVAARVPGLMLGTEGSGRSDRSLEIVARNLGNWKLRGIARLVCDNSESPQDAVGRTAERLPRRTPPSAALRSSSARPRSTSRKLPTRQIRHLDLRPNVRCSGACSYPMRLLGFSVGYSEAAFHDRPLLAQMEWTPPSLRGSEPH